MIHVLIVEDDPMARKLFEIILQESDRYIVTAAIESASLAEFYCMTSTVDLILMDVCTALRSSGLEAAAKIKKIYPKKKIIIVTSQPECDFVERARTSEEFTARELEVLRELTSGDTDDEIAKRLHISIHTVKKYVKTLLQKTGFTTRTQLAVMARESGIVIRGF